MRSQNAIEEAAKQKMNCSRRADHSVLIPVTDTESSQSPQNPSLSTGRQVFRTPHFREMGAINVVTNAIRIRASKSANFLCPLFGPLLFTQNPFRVGIMINFTRSKTGQKIIPKNGIFRLPTLGSRRKIYPGSREVRLSNWLTSSLRFDPTQQ